MVTTSGDRPVSEIAAEWAEQLKTRGPAPSIWQQDQPGASIPLGGQLHGRPYVGPPTEPSRALPRQPLKDPIAIAYAEYSQAVTSACRDFRTAQDIAWQEYTRVMQDASAAYDIDVRRAAITLDGKLDTIARG